MRTSTKFLAILICIILITRGVVPALAADTPGYKIAIPCIYDGGFIFNGGVAPVQNKGKYGLIDKAGNTVAPFVYDSCNLLWSPNSDETQCSYFIVIQNKKWGVIDKSGRLVVPCKYDGIWSGGDGLAIVGIGKWVPPGPPNLSGLWGLVDLRTGKEILPVKYSNILPSDDFSLYTVFMNNKPAVIDPAGNVIVPIGTFDHMFYFRSGFASVYKNGKAGIIDKFGRVVIPLVYDRVEPFSNGGITIAIKGNKYGVLNTSGKLVVPCSYDEGRVYTNGVIQMRKGDKTALFNSTGKFVASTDKYHFVEQATDNLIFVERDGKIGAIDMTGKEIVPFVYTGVKDANHGLAVVIKNDMSGVINQSGSFILPLDKYGTLNVRDDGCILVESPANFKQGLKDFKGRTILPYEYDSIYGMDDGYVVAENKQGTALFNKDGDLIVPFGKYNYIDSRINENMVTVAKDGLFGYINLPEYVEKPDAWAKPEVDRAIAAGLVSEDMRRGYQDNITRADFCRLAVNLIELKTGMKMDVFMNTRGMSGRVSNPIAFKDTNAPVIIAASRLGIVYGIGNNRFDPSGIISRQDAAVMLQRTAMVLDFTEPKGTPQVFADRDKISSYAVDAIDFVSTAADKESGNKVMGGTGNGNFSPQANYTSQQAYITILRLFNAIR